MPPVPELRDGEGLPGPLGACSSFPGSEGDCEPEAWRPCCSFLPLWVTVQPARCHCPLREALPCEQGAPFGEELAREMGVCQGRQPAAATRLDGPLPLAVQLGASPWWRVGVCWLKGRVGARGEVAEPPRKPSSPGCAENCGEARSSELADSFQRSCLCHAAHVWCHLWPVPGSGICCCS